MLRERYKELKVETSRLEKESEKEKAQMENGVKRIDDLKKGKTDN